MSKKDNILTTMDARDCWAVGIANVTYTRNLHLLHVGREECNLEETVDDDGIAARRRWRLSHSALWVVTTTSFSTGDLFGTPTPSQSQESSAKTIDKKAIAQTIQNEIAKEVHSLSKKFHKVPGLAAVIVDDWKDSKTNVSMKGKACVVVGIHILDF